MYTHTGFPRFGQADLAGLPILGTFFQSGIGRLSLFLYIPRFPKPTKEKDL
jgi:hypothetical protein